MEPTESYHVIVQVSGGSNYLRGLLVQGLVKCDWTDIEVVFLTLLWYKAQCRVDSAWIAWIQLYEWESLNSGSLKFIISQSIMKPFQGRQGVNFNMYPSIQTES